MPTTPDDERGRACGALGPARGAPCRPCSPKTTCVTDFDCGALFAAGEAHDPSADDRVDRRMHFRRVFGEGVLEPSWAVCDDNPLPRNPSAPKGNIRGALGASFATSAEVLVTALRLRCAKARQERRWSARRLLPPPNFPACRNYHRHNRRNRQYLPQPTAHTCIIIMRRSIRRLTCSFTLSAQDAIRCSGLVMLQRGSSPRSVNLLQSLLDVSRDGVKREEVVKEIDC